MCSKPTSVTRTLASVYSVLLYLALWAITLPMSIDSDAICLATGQAAIAMTDASGHASWPLDCRHHWGEHDANGCLYSLPAECLALLAQRGLGASALDLPCAVPRAVGKCPEMHVACSQR